MKDESSFHDIRSANFELWNPVCSPDGSGVLCSFDVTSPEFLGINEGTGELVRGFIASLDVCVGELEGWIVDRFVSPYFANDPEMNDWRSLFGLAWRFTVKVSGVTRYRPSGKVGPYPAAGLDTTWRAGASSPTKNERERCVIIANEGPDRDFSDLAEYSVNEQLDIVTHHFPHGDVREARLDLGEVMLPDSVETIQYVLWKAKARFMTTNCWDASDRTAWQKTSDWIEW
ncbi:hypothetical protein ACWFRQ_02110 [Streptomyces niveus]